MFRHFSRIISIMVTMLVFAATAMAVTTNYTYDNLYRLTMVSRSDGTVIQYQYDEAGNRTRKIVQGVIDITPPTPNPMTFASSPTATSSTAISMTATTATDTTSPPVTYYFSFVNSPTGGTGGADLTWQSGTTYTNSGLQPNHQYGYQVKAQDAASSPNPTQPSATVYKYTLANVPVLAAYSGVTQTAIQANWTANGNRTGTEYYCENTTRGTNSNWITSLSWNETGLTCGTSYTYRVKARNGDGIETVSWTTLGAYNTLSCGAPPTPSPMTWAAPPTAAGSTSITMTASTATDADNPPVSYYFKLENSPTGGTGGTDLDWQPGTTYTNSGLQSNHQYGYRVIARDSASPPNETQPSATVYKFTLANPPASAVFSNVTKTSIQAEWLTNGNRMGTEYYCENTTRGTNSGWAPGLVWNETGLNCGTNYTYRVKARNGDGIETVWADLGSKSTLECLSSTLANPIYVGGMNDSVVPKVLGNNPSTGKVYLGQTWAFPTGRILVIDDATGTVEATIPVSIEPQAIAVNTSTGKTYVAPWLSTNTMYVIDGLNNLIEFQASSQDFYRMDVATNPSSNKVYVAGYLWTGGPFNIYLSIFNGNDLTFKPTIDLGAGDSSEPKIAVNGNANKVYVTGQDAVTVIDGQTDAILSTIPVGTYPRDILVNPTNNQVYVVNKNSNNVSVIDSISNTVIQTIPVGNTPWAITLNPQTNKIYVANNGDGTVSVIDGNSNSVVDTLNIGGAPSVVKVDKDLNRLYVGNGSHFLSIDGTTNTVYEPGLFYQPGTGYQSLKDMAVMPSHKAYTADNNGWWYILADIDREASSVQANPITVPVGCSSNSTIMVTLLDTLGAPVSGVNVTITVSGSGNVITGFPSKTGLDGKVTGQICSYEEGAKIITAILPDGKTLVDTETVTFTPCPLPGIPGLISPENGSQGVSATPTLDWADVSGATTYEVQVCSDAACNAVLQSQTGLITSQWTMAMALTNGATYHWRVRAVNACGNGAWSGTYSFTFQVALPGSFSKTSPANGAPNQPTNPTLSWGSSTGAASYEYCYDTTNNNACDGNWTSTGSNTSVNLSGLTNGTTYYWQVQARNAAGPMEAAGGWWSFTTACPAPSIPSTPSPANGATGISPTPTLTWTASGADSYDVYFGTAANPPLMMMNTTNTNYHPTGLTGGATYYWKIVAKNNCGQSTAGPVWSFTTDASGVTIPFTVLLNGSPFADLEWGWKPNATDNYDNGIDYSAPPPPYDGDDAYFLSITGQASPLDKLRNDFRAMADEAKTWKLVLKVADEKTLKLQWDPETLPAGWTFTLQEANASWVGTGSPVINLNSTPSEITLDNQTGELMTRRYLVRAFLGFPLTLKAGGWNLISLPVEPLDPAPAAVFGPNLLSIYEWDASGRLYAVPSALQAKKGYWVAVSQDADLEVIGGPPSTSSMHLLTGWNLVGPVETGACPSGSPVLVVFGWGWPPNYQYVIPTKCEEGKGYWVAASQEGDIW